MHPNGGNPPDSHANAIPNNPNEPLISPELLAHFRNILNGRAPHHLQQPVPLPVQQFAPNPAFTNHLPSTIGHQLAAQTGQIRPLQPLIGSNEGGVVHYHPTSVLHILSGILDQVESLRRTYQHIINSLQIPEAILEQIVHNMPESQTELANLQKRASESGPSPLQPGKASAMRNSGPAREHNTGPLVVPQPRLMSPPNEEVPRAHALYTIADPRAQQNLKRHVPSTLYEHMEAVKRARPDVVKQITDLQAAIITQQVNASALLPAADLLRNIPSHFAPPSVTQNNVANQQGPPTPHSIVTDGQPNSSRSSHASDSGTSGNSPSKPSSSSKMRAPQAFKPTLGPMSSTFLENWMTSKNQIGLNVPTTATSSVEVLDQGKSQQLRLYHAGVDMALAKSLQKISSEEKTATEALLGLHKRTATPAQKYVRIPDTTIFVPVDKLSAEAQARETKHRCSTACPKNCAENSLE